MANINELPKEYEEKLDALYEKWKKVESVTVVNRYGGDEVEWYIESLEMSTSLGGGRLGSTEMVGGVVEVAVELKRWRYGHFWKASGRMNAGGEINITDEPVNPEPF